MQASAPSCLDSIVTFFPDVCSGHGECNEEAQTCVCEDSWTGRSHWVDLEAAECHIHVTVVQAFWGFLLLLMLGVYVIHFRRYWNVFIRFRRVQLVKMSHNQIPRPLRKHTTLFCLTIFFFLHGPLHFAMCILLLVNTRQRIGFDFWPTFLWHAGRSSFYVCTSLYQPSMLSSIIGRQDLERLGTLTHPTSQVWILTGCHFFLGSLAWVVYARPDDFVVQTITWWAFFGGTALVFYVMGFQAWYLKRLLSKRLSAAYDYRNDEEILKTKVRMESVQNLIVRHSFFQAVVYTCFAAVPQLFGWYDYLLPLSWITIPSTARVVVRTLIVESKQTNFKASGIPTIVSDARHGNKSTTFFTEGTVQEVSDVENLNLTPGQISFLEVPTTEDR